MDIIFTVEKGDALSTQADVLALKYAQGLYGVSKAAANRLRVFHEQLLTTLPGDGEFLLLETYGSLAASHVLFVGTPPLNLFGYHEIREFARRVLASLAQEMPQVRHICMTLHGANYGLDESEAFESEVIGCIDAIRDRAFPTKLEKVTFVEQLPGRVSRLQKKLLDLLPEGTISVTSGQQRPLQMVDKPPVFVAMPFDEKMDDVFYYGIYPPLNDAGFLCERADLTSFTGDIMQWVKDRIDSAVLVIADLSMAKPNVYLEVGYAWGRNKPTILLIQEAEELEFDVRGQRCLVYKKIKDLEEQLRKELKAFSP